MSADSSQASPEKRLEDMIRLGELCMEVLQQNDEHHSEVRPVQYLLIKSFLFPVMKPFIYFHYVSLINAFSFVSRIKLNTSTFLFIMNPPSILSYIFQSFTT